VLVDNALRWRVAISAN